MGPGSGGRRAHYYRDGWPLCGALIGAPYTGTLRPERDMITNCDRCDCALGRGRRQRLAYDSRLCLRCDRDYLYPAYGSQRGICNDCLMSYQERPRKGPQHHC